jgi:hypothetical protein
MALANLVHKNKYWLKIRPGVFPFPNQHVIGEWDAKACVFAVNKRHPSDDYPVPAEYHPDTVLILGNETLEQGRKFMESLEELSVNQLVQLQELIGNEMKGRNSNAASE